MAARVEELSLKPGRGRGYRASQYVEPLVWMLQAGGRRLEDMRELWAEQAVLRRLWRDELPSADAQGDWLRRCDEPLNTSIADFAWTLSCCPHRARPVRMPVWRLFSNRKRDRHGGMVWNTEDTGCAA